MNFSQPSKTTQVSKVELPPWVNQASHQNYDLAKHIAAQPLKQYQGPLVAGVPVAEQQAINHFPVAAQAASNTFLDAKHYLHGVLATDPTTVTAQQVDPNISADTITPQQVGTGYTADSVSSDPLNFNATARDVNAPTVTAGMLANTDLSPYMNPYINDVVNTSMTTLNDQLTKQLQDNASKSSAAGAFGGSRSGVVDALTNSEAQKNAGALVSQLYSQGFNTATNNATNDLNRGLTLSTTNAANSLASQKYNQDAGLTASAQNLQGALADQAAALDASKSNQATDLAAAGLNQKGALANQASDLAAQTTDAANRLQAGQLNLQGALANQSSDLAAQEANQNTSIADKTANTAASTALSNLGENQQKSSIQNLLGALQGGAADQTTAQNKINAAVQKFQQKVSYPTDQLNILLAALGMSPYGKTQTTNTTGTPANSGPDVAMAGMGALSMLLPLLMA